MFSQSRDALGAARGVHVRTFSLLLLIFSVGASSSAQAIYVDFADFRGAAVGSGAEIEAEGLSITISSRPTDFDLSITRAGLGVACTDRRRNCRGNSAAEIDAEWREAIIIDFNNGPVAVQSLDFSRITRGDVAVVRGGDERWRAEANRNRGGSLMRVEMEGEVLQRLVVTTSGRFSDAALRGIEFEWLSDSVGVVTPPGTTNPVPEPSAALLYGAGISLLGARVHRVRRARSRQD